MKNRTEVYEAIIFYLVCVDADRSHIFSGKTELKKQSTQDNIWTCPESCTVGGLHNLYLSPDIIRQIKSRRMRWAGHVARMAEGRNVYRVSLGKPEGKRPLGRPRRRWENGIKMDLREIGWGVWSGIDNTFTRCYKT
jgi:hypothetical protein